MYDYYFFVGCKTTVVNFCFSDPFQDAVTFQEELLSSKLATEKLAVLLVTIALAVGGLIYFCIHITGIFPEKP